MGGRENGQHEEGQMGEGGDKGTVVGDVDVVDIQDTSMEGLVESLKLRLVELQTKNEKIGENKNKITEACDCMNKEKLTRIR